MDAFGGDVMIGEDEAVGGDERAGAAVIEAHRREAEMMEQASVTIELILLPELLRGREVEQPHALFRRRQRGHGAKQGKEGEKNAAGHRSVLRSIMNWL